MEEWKWIKGYEGLYEISNMGRVRTHKKNRRSEFLSNKRLNADGYVHVALRKDGKAKEFRVNRLVAFHFIGEPKDKNMTVNHINGIKTDDRVENLEWSTLKQQMRHAYDNNLKKPIRGMRAVDEKTKEQIKQLYQKGKHGRSAKALGERFGISATTVERIVGARKDRTY